MNKVKNIVTLHLFCFVTAFAAAAFGSYIAGGKSTNDAFGVRMEEVLSCGPKKYTNSGRFLYQKVSGKELKKDHQSNNNTRKGKNNGNGCSHQPTAGTLCEITGPKRRFLKVHSC